MTQLRPLATCGSIRGGCLGADALAVRGFPHNPQVLKGFPAVFTYIAAPEGGVRTDEEQSGMRPNTGTADLTARELDVLNGVRAGKSNREIAEDLGLAEGTVANYVSHAFAKLGVTNRTQAALAMVERGGSDMTEPAVS